MTQAYLGDWLDAANHYRMQLLGDAADNPDQRIADDLRMFVESTLSIGTRLLNACGTLFAFVVILWTLSDRGAARAVRLGLRYSRISGLGGADLRRRRQRADASDRLAAHSAQFSAAAFRGRLPL